MHMLLKLMERHKINKEVKGQPADQGSPGCVHSIKQNTSLTNCMMTWEIRVKGNTTCSCLWWHGCHDVQFVLKFNHPVSQPKLTMYSNTSHKTTTINCEISSTLRTLSTWADNQVFTKLQITQIMSQKTHFCLSNCDSAFSSFSCRSLCLADIYNNNNILSQLSEWVEFYVPLYT